MDTITAIKTRRSIRKFKSGDIRKDQINEILSLAMLAPSAGNSQCWEFIVIDDREKLDSIPDIHPYSSMIKTAQIAILVCGNTEMEKFPGFWVQDCSAAIQNILLAVHNMGLGGVWCGVHPNVDLIAKFSSKFALPEHVKPLGLVVIGVPDMESKEADRFDAEKVHYNVW